MPVQQGEGIGLEEIVGVQKQKPFADSPRKRLIPRPARAQRLSVLHLEDFYIGPTGHAAKGPLQERVFFHIGHDDGIADHFLKGSLERT